MSTLYVVVVDYVVVDYVVLDIVVDDGVTEKNVLLGCVVVNCAVMDNILKDNDFLENSVPTTHCRAWKLIYPTTSYQVVVLPCNSHPEHHVSPKEEGSGCSNKMGKE